MFEALLGHSEPVGVLWLSGQGGVGKTALMQAWPVMHNNQAGARSASMDGPHLSRQKLRRCRRLGRRGASFVLAANYPRDDVPTSNRLVRFSECYSPLRI